MAEQKTKQIQSSEKKSGVNPNRQIKNAPNERRAYYVQ
jgi:hypothetical protein